MVFFRELFFHSLEGQVQGSWHPFFSSPHGILFFFPREKKNMLAQNSWWHMLWSYECQATPRRRPQKVPRIVPRVLPRVLPRVRPNKRKFAQNNNLRQKHCTSPSPKIKNCLEILNVKNNKCKNNTNAPRITQVSPLSGGSGDIINIHGNHLGSVTQVLFGTASSTFAIVSDCELNATVPSNLPASTVTITVQNPFGDATFFPFQVTAIAVQSTPVHAQIAPFAVQPVLIQPVVPNNNLPPSKKTSVPFQDFVPPPLFIMHHALAQQYYR